MNDPNLLAVYSAPHIIFLFCCLICFVTVLLFYAIVKLNKICIIDVELRNWEGEWTMYVQNMGPIIYVHHVYDMHQSYVLVVEMFVFIINVI